MGTLFRAWTIFSGATKKGKKGLSATKMAQTPKHFVTEQLSDKTLADRIALSVAKEEAVTCASCSSPALMLSSACGCFGVSWSRKNLGTWVCTSRSSGREAKMRVSCFFLFGLF